MYCCNHEHQVPNCFEDRRAEIMNLSTDLHGNKFLFETHYDIGHVPSSQKFIEFGSHIVEYSQVFYSI